MTLLLIGGVSIPYVARPIRGRVLALRSQSYVEAAVPQGASSGRVMGVEIVPHLAFTIVAIFSVLFTNAIVLEAALSFRRWAR